MKLEELQKRVKELATLPDTGAPVMSCYVNLEECAPSANLESRFREISLQFEGEQLRNLEDSWLAIQSYLDGAEWHGRRGAAIFARSGKDRLFLPLTFKAPLPTWMSVGRAPNIYHLVELKDTYHRYVVMLSTEKHARILEVNLGAVTRQLLLARRDLRSRVGREWTREHYRSHLGERSNQFLREQIHYLEKLIDAGGYGHLILAGSPQVIAQVRKALPRRLKDRLVDAVPVSAREALDDVVAATLTTFIEEEERASVSVVAELLRELRLGGPAVTGAGPVTAYLTQGIADTVVLSSSLDETEREEIVRLAVKTGCHVEVVTGSDELDQLGGVGALLRYQVAA